ncbi:hypothetical protein QBA54_39725 [Streptomyces sp. B21-108]|uniref:hypothetical protein n=1 Tax=Streptomyces sp. B21-108 TaxID=3039419 RepID=UPI002FEE9F5B
MKLITFDDGRVGRLELEERLVLPLEVRSTRSTSSATARSWRRVSDCGWTT